MNEIKKQNKRRTKEKTEQLYKQVDGVWTEAESVAKKVLERHYRYLYRTSAIIS